MVRAFSRLEKKLIVSLLDLDGRKGLNVLNNVVLSYIPNYYYISVYSDSDADVMIQDQMMVNLDLNEVYEYVSDLLITTIVLLDYLVEQKYVFFSGYYDIDCLGVKSASDSYIRANILDKDLIEKLHFYSTKRFYVTEAFREFVANGYVTEEQKNQQNELSIAKKNLTYTRIALGFSLSGLIASVLIPLFSTTSIKIEDKVINVSSNQATLEHIDRKFMTYDVLIKALSSKLDSRLEELNNKPPKQLVSEVNSSAAEDLLQNKSASNSDVPKT